MNESSEKMFTTKFYQAFEREINCIYAGCIPNNAQIALNIVEKSNLEFLRNETIRKWRLGLSTPQLTHLIAISQWLEKILIVSAQGFDYVEPSNSNTAYCENRK